MSKIVLVFVLLSSTLFASDYLQKAKEFAGAGKTIEAKAILKAGLKESRTQEAEELLMEIMQNEGQKSSSLITRSLKRNIEVVKLTNSAPSIDINILFEYNSHQLTSSGKNQSNELGSALKSLLQDEPGSRFVIVGHTDEHGSEEYNKALSQKRAKSVVEYISSKFDLPNGSIKSEGRGESELLFVHQGANGDKLNRRVEAKREN